MGSASSNQCLFHAHSIWAHTSTTSAAFNRLTSVDQHGLGHIHTVMRRCVCVRVCVSAYVRIHARLRIHACVRISCICAQNRVCAQIEERQRDTHIYEELNTGVYTR